ncbi:hypothetical protein Gpo141_00011007 [Globisporangium polare]
MSSATCTSSTSSTSSVLATHKRARPAVPDLPTSVAWLEHTTFEMTASASKTGLAQCSTEYVLHVHHRTSGGVDPESKAVVSWDVARSFEDYGAFRKRLMATLALGHACSAECKWLHSFAKKYFPKKRLFANCSTALMIVRREKLGRFLHVLRSSLLNRGNHGCPIVVNSLAAEFAAFIEGERRLVKAAAASSTDRDERWSVNSSISTTSTDASDYHDDRHIGELESVCDLCSRSLDGGSEAGGASACDTTTLSCSHQFHDGCVLPKLAALEFRCPTCQESQL